MLLDTSGLFCLLSSRESGHDLAKAMFAQSARSMVHNYVLTEMVALGIARGVPSERVLAFLIALVEVPEVELVWVDEVLHDRGMQLLRERTDKAYTLCDAVSFTLMRDRAVTDALTTDHHFSQEGFRKLLQ